MYEDPSAFVTVGSRSHTDNQSRAILFTPPVFPSRPLTLSRGFRAGHGPPASTLVDAG